MIWMAGFPKKKREKMSQNLSNYHFVVYWSKWSVTLVARELSKLGLAGYPGDLRDTV